jgi:hypothetical protein
MTIMTVLERSALRTARACRNGARARSVKTLPGEFSESAAYRGRATGARFGRANERALDGRLGCGELGLGAWKTSGRRNARVRDASDDGARQRLAFERAERAASRSAARSFRAGRARARASEHRSSVSSHRIDTIRDRSQLESSQLESSHRIDAIRVARASVRPLIERRACSPITATCQRPPRRSRRQRRPRAADTRRWLCGDVVSLPPSRAAARDEAFRAETVSSDGVPA